MRHGGRYEQAVLGIVGAIGHRKREVGPQDRKRVDGLDGSLQLAAGTVEQHARGVRGVPGRWRQDKHVRV